MANKNTEDRCRDDRQYSHRRHEKAVQLDNAQTSIDLLIYFEWDVLYKNTLYIICVMQSNICSQTTYEIKFIQYVFVPF